MPSLGFPPVRAHRFSEAAFRAGVEKHKIDGVTVRIYNPEKTIADCFKFRNKIGMDIVLEALKLINLERNSIRVNCFDTLNSVGLQRL